MDSDEKYILPGYEDVMKCLDDLMSTLYSGKEDNNDSRTDNY